MNMQPRWISSLKLHFFTGTHERYLLMALQLWILFLSMCVFAFIFYLSGFLSFLLSTVVVFGWMGRNIAFHFFFFFFFLFFFFNACEEKSSYGSARSPIQETTFCSAFPPSIRHFPFQWNQRVFSHTRTS